MMQYWTYLISKALRCLWAEIVKPLDWLFSWWVFYSNNAQFSTFSNRGWPKVNVGRGGVLKIGAGFRSNNREMANPIGRFHACSLIVAGSGELIIGKNVGMSSAAIVCHHRIEIGDNVNLGGGVVIYDTDFHSLKPEERQSRQLDIANKKTAPVKIGDNAFIGAHATILKGVSIGREAVIGACSLVACDVPDGEIWAGNPAIKIRTLDS